MNSGTVVSIGVAIFVLLARPAIALETCDLNNDAKTTIGDLLLLQQALTSPPDPTPPQAPLTLSLGKGNELFEPTTASFAQEWNVVATDGLGRVVENRPVQVSIRSVFFYKGFLVQNVVEGRWQYSPVNQPPIKCPDEDANRNGILEPAEDLNGSGQMEAGLVAVLAPVPLSAPADRPCDFATPVGTTAIVMPNDQGIARVCVLWPRNFSWWVDAQITATMTLSGADYTRAELFSLPASPVDVNDISVSPPNVVSPFGVEQDCSIPPPGLPLL